MPKVYVLKLKGDPRTFVFSTMELAKAACTEYADLIMPEGWSGISQPSSFHVGKVGIEPGDRWEAWVSEEPVDGTKFAKMLLNLKDVLQSERELGLHS